MAAINCSCGDFLHHQKTTMATEIQNELCRRDGFCKKLYYTLIIRVYCCIDHIDTDELQQLLVCILFLGYPYILLILYVL